MSTTGDPTAYQVEQITQQRMEELNKKSKENFVAVNGVRLHYVCKGDGLNAILCIPGGLGTVDDFQLQLDYFGRAGSRYKMVCFDPRGFGKSQHLNRPLDGYAIDAKDGHEIMQTLSLYKYAVLGICSGGAAAIFLATMFPQSVEKLVVISTRTYISNDDLTYMETLRDYLTWPVQLKEEKLKVYGSSLQRVWSSCLDTLHYYHAEKNGDICSSELSKITCPLLIIHSKYDRNCRLIHGKYLRDHVKGSRLEVIDSYKHMVHMSHPQEVNKLIADFLELTDS